MKDRRQFIRHTAEFPIRINAARESRPRKIVTRDISFGGVCITQAKPMVPGRLVCLAIPVSQRVFRIKGRVSYCYSQTSWRLYKIGIAFLHPSSLFIFKLAEEMLTIQKFHRQMQRELGRSISEQEAAEQWIRKNARAFADLFDRYQADPAS